MKTMLTNRLAAMKNARIYKASRNAWEQGQNPLKAYFSTDDAVVETRNFGIEIEFNSDEILCIGENCFCDCRCMGYGPLCDNCLGVCCDDAYGESPFADFLYEKGILEDRRATMYHASDDYTKWRYESDSTVTGGEIITPIMKGEGASWETIHEVMHGVLMMGGVDYETNVGGHISINAPEFIDNPASLRRFARLIASFEDVMFRLATNPHRVNRTDEGALSLHRGQFGTAYAFSDRDIAEMLASSRPYKIAAKMTRHRWVHYDHDETGRVEFRIFDGSLDASLSQTWTMIASALIDAACNPALEEYTTQLPLRRFGWHNKKGLRDDLSTIGEFVDLLFTNDQDKERVITLFAGNDWNIAPRNL